MKEKEKEKEKGKVTTFGYLTCHRCDEIGTIYNRVS